jgi:hypothetical protein
MASPNLERPYFCALSVLPRKPGKGSRPPQARLQSVHPTLNSFDLQVAFILQPDLEIPRNYALESLSYYLTARQDERPAGKCSKAEASPQPVISQNPAGRHKEDP